MSTDTTTCGHCDARPAGKDHFVCKECIATAKQQLWSIGYLVEHLDGARARLRARDYASVGGRSAERPVPYDPRVTRRYVAASNALLGIHKIVTEGRTSAPAVGKFTLRQMAFWIGGNLDALAALPQAGDELRAIDGVFHDLEGFFTRPPDAYYLGLCKKPGQPDEYGEPTECHEPIYTNEIGSAATQGYITCPRCAEQIDMSVRRAEIKEAVKGHLATMAELVRLAPILHDDLPVSQSSLYRAVADRDLKPSGWSRATRDKMGRRIEVDLYKIGDVQQAIEQRAKRTSRRVAS